MHYSVQACYHRLPPLCSVHVLMVPCGALAIVIMLLFGTQLRPMVVGWRGGGLDIALLDDLEMTYNTQQFGAAGYRSPYLSHAKRALYHLSYSPGGRYLGRAQKWYGLIMNHVLNS